MQSSSVVSSVAPSSERAPVGRSRAAGRSSLDRWFFTVAGVLALVASLIGFEQFYFHGRQFPGREIAPPMRTLVIVHGTAMALWVLLVVFQPLLVAMSKRKLHMTVGRIGAVLAAGIVVMGLMIGVQSARVTPPEARIMGFTPKEFMAVPVISVLVFGTMVGIAVWKRKKPAIHRAMMLSATVGILSAALNRIDALNQLYVGTAFDRVFGPFFFAVVLGWLLVAARCAIVRSFDKWLTTGIAIVTLVSVGIVILAKTSAWNAIATMLVPGQG